MMSNGFIVKSEVMSDEEDATPSYVELRIRDDEADDDQELFVIEVEIGHIGQTLLLNQANAAALAEALAEILSRYGWKYYLKK